MITDEIRFIKKYGLTENNLSYDFLKQIFKKKGYTIIFFNKSYNDNNVQSLIEAYGLEEEIATRKVFIFTNGTFKLLFLHENIGEDELIHYMLHDLGHICLKHTPNVNEDFQEREADEFAVHIKTRLKQLSVIKNTSIALFAIVLAFLFAASNSHNSYSDNSIYVTATPEFLQKNISSNDVIITKSGEKYHLPDCQYVKNKTNTINMSEKEALNAGYEPCAVCRPDK